MEQATKFYGQIATNSFLAVLLYEKIVAKQCSDSLQFIILFHHSLIYESLFSP